MPSLSWVSVQDAALCCCEAKADFPGAEGRRALMIHSSETHARKTLQEACDGNWLSHVDKYGQCRTVLTSLTKPYPLLTTGGGLYDSL